MIEEEGIGKKKIFFIDIIYFLEILLLLKYVENIGKYCFIIIF